MKKILLSLLALTFAAGVGTSALAAGEKKADDAVAKACKDKKPGEEVTVDGKKVKCPEKK